VAQPSCTDTAAPLHVLLRERIAIDSEGLGNMWPVFSDASLFTRVVEHMAAPFAGRIDKVAGIESRGFLLGAALANELGVGIVPVRKPGKLPYKTRRVDYALEYGTDALEMHIDALEKGQRVVIVDDLLATGGTVRGTIDLVERLQGKVVGLAFLVELEFLRGRERLQGQRVESVIRY